MSALSLYAGPIARERILNQGLDPTLFKLFVGASGGPKWFVLYGLDRVLFGDFFAGRSEPLLTLGSSAGAWRLSCLGTAQPVAALERLATLYSGQRYSAKPDIAEVTEKARVMVAGILGESGAREIANNPVIKTHIVADRARGLMSSGGRAGLVGGLLGSAVANVASRRSLGLFYERVVFSSMGAMSPFQSLADIPTCVVELSPSNVQQAMLASGSIPFVLEGERDIPGARPGLYLDGGITDYHFDLPFHGDEGLVLYPHFSSRLIPGWFDKKLPWRKVTKENFRNVLLLAPSEEFVSSLPLGKIPDRNDFRRYGEDERILLWQEVLEKSKRLADEFLELVDTGITEDRLLPLIGN